MIRKLLSTVLKYLFEMKETLSLEYGLIDSVLFTNHMSCLIFSTVTEGIFTRSWFSLCFFHWRQWIKLPLILWKHYLAPSDSTSLFSPHFPFEKDTAWKIVPWLEKDLKINTESYCFSAHVTIHSSENYSSYHFNKSREYFFKGVTFHFLFLSTI